MTRHIETFDASWNGIQLAISWEPRWLNLSDDYGLDTAHLQIEAVERPRPTERLDQAVHLDHRIAHGANLAATRRSAP